MNYWTIENHTEASLVVGMRSLLVAPTNIDKLIGISIFALQIYEAI